LKRVLGWGVLVAAFVLLLGGVGWLVGPSSLRGYNLLFSLRGPEEPESPIVIVSIDEDSFDELDAQWPWARAVHGELLDILSRGEPIAIGIDLLFSEPSGYGPEDDAALSAAIRRAGNVVLAAAATETMTAVGPKRDMNLPLPLLREGAAGFGSVSTPIDPDANIRRAQFTTSTGGQQRPGFLSHLYEIGARAGISTQGPSAPDSIRINFRGGPGTYPRIPYYRLLNGEVSPDAVKGKIVLRRHHTDSARCFSGAVCCAGEHAWSRNSCPRPRDGISRHSDTRGSMANYRSRDAAGCLWWNLAFDGMPSAQGIPVYRRRMGCAGGPRLRALQAEYLARHGWPDTGARLQLFRRDRRGFRA
jgi:hypothetical protein